MHDKGLPYYPVKGSRQEVDRAWLDLLYRESAARHLPAVPAPPPELYRAIQEFNQGRYWDCHETLEDIWLREGYPLRLFYHALIKAAVGLLHAQRRNRHGALMKLSDAEYTLQPFLPQFMGIETQRLHKSIKKRLEYLETDPAVDWPLIEALPPVQIGLCLPNSRHSQPGG